MRITNDELEKNRLNFSRCPNLDESPLINIATTTQNSFLRKCNHFTIQLDNKFILVNDFSVFIFSAGLRAVQSPSVRLIDCP